MAAAKKGGLGKGLGALIAEAAPVEITRKNLWKRMKRIHRIQSNI